MKQALQHIQSIGLIRGTIFLAAVAAIVLNLAIYGPDDADKTASIVAGLLAALALLGGGNSSPTLTLTDSLQQIAEQVRDIWIGQERRRGLRNVRFVPLRVRVISGLEPGSPARTYLETPAKSPIWSMQDMQRSCAASVFRFEVRRTVIFGADGSGKSTLAVALTLGLLERYSFVDGGLIPLTLSLNSWNPSDDDFRAWLDKRLETVYPVLRSIARGDDGIAQKLTSSGKFVFILDGLDEIHGRTDLRRELDEIAEFFPETQRLCILSRDSTVDDVDLPQTVKLRLCLSTTKAIRNYLAKLEDETSIADIANYVVKSREGERRKMRPSFAFLRPPSIYAWHIRQSPRAVLQFRIYSPHLATITS